GHGTTHRIIMKVIDEMGVQSETIGIAPVGCSVLAYEFMNIDMQQAAHGRAPAIATALKRLMPKKYIFTYQGDGDLAAIGTAETIHACNRGEHFTIFFINNGIYGMTGGQMAPTTLPGMRTSTSPYGRDVQMMGNPLKITELVAQLPGAYYVTRQAVHTPSNVRKTKRAVRKAFELQQSAVGISLIEIVSNCNSGWKMTPRQANTWMEENMFPFYPLGDIKVDGELVKK
ncbi:MAG: 2-oxoglutarate oxidoreductase, partial [Bacteroidetes bacterium]|nr:2-oxoglutarate oxidoreductase [Bacteroidota bacterium]